MGEGPSSQTGRQGRFPDIPCCAMSGALSVVQDLYTGEEGFSDTLRTGLSANRASAAHQPFPIESRSAYARLQEPHDRIGQTGLDYPDNPDGLVGRAPGDQSRDRTARTARSADAMHRSQVRSLLPPLRLQAFHPPE